MGSGSAHIELLRRVFEAGGADSVEAAIAHAPPDVVWHMPAEWPEEREYRGHDGIARVMTLWNEYFDDYHAEIEELVEAGERVLGLLWLMGRSPTTGEVVRQQVGAV
jgi:ketosteroid isomerase-like protein